MIGYAGLLALAAAATHTALPAPVTVLLASVRANDLPAAQATVTEDAIFMDGRSGRPVASSLAAFVDATRGCEHSIAGVDRDAADPGRAAVVIHWLCPSGPRSQSFVWTDGPRIVWIQFGMSEPR